MSEKTVKKACGALYELRGLTSTGCPDCAAYRDPAACNSLSEGGACQVSEAAHWVKVAVVPPGGPELSRSKVEAVADALGYRAHIREALRGEA